MKNEKGKVYLSCLYHVFTLIHVPPPPCLYLEFVSQVGEMAKQSSSFNKSRQWFRVRIFVFVDPGLRVRNFWNNMKITICNGRTNPDFGCKCNGNMSECSLDYLIV